MANSTFLMIVKMNITIIIFNSLFLLNLCSVVSMVSNKTEKQQSHSFVQDCSTMQDILRIQNPFNH